FSRSRTLPFTCVGRPVRLFRLVIVALITADGFAARRPHSVVGYPAWNAPCAPDPLAQIWFTSPDRSPDRIVAVPVLISDRDPSARRRRSCAVSVEPDRE